MSRTKTNKGKCECGCDATITIYCKKCYYKYYQRKASRLKGIKPKTKKIRFVEQTLFNKILASIENGNTIENACKLNNISRRYLYENMSSIQKNIVTATKLSSTKSSFTYIADITIEKHFTR